MSTASGHENAISVLVGQWRAELQEAKAEMGEEYFGHGTSARKARAYARGLGRAIDDLRELFGEDVCGPSEEGDT